MQEVSNLIRNQIKGNPYMEAKSPIYWYIVDKDSIHDETDYLKQIYLETYIGRELLPDAMVNLDQKGFFEMQIELTPDDSAHFERHIEERDKIKISQNDEEISLMISDIQLITIRPNEFHIARFTLNRV